MLDLLDKTFVSLKRRGLRKTTVRVARYLIGATPLEERFTDIYYDNVWDCDESASGAGSTLKHTENLRNKLPDLFKTFSVKSLFDAPCGDFNWMRHLLKECDLTYVGGDVVSPMIESLNAGYANSKTKFVHIDLTKGRFPEADVMLCRDCLCHLSFHDSRLVLQNFISSNIAYLLTSNNPNFENKFTNYDIRSGSARKIDLFSAPYNFSSGVLYRIEENPEAEMCLWTRDQVIGAMKQWLS